MTTCKYNVCLTHHKKNNHSRLLWSQVHFYNFKKENKLKFECFMKEIIHQSLVTWLIFLGVSISSPLNLMTVSHYGRRNSLPEYLSSALKTLWNSCDPPYEVITNNTDIGETRFHKSIVLKMCFLVSARRSRDPLYPPRIHLQRLYTSSTAGRFMAQGLLCHITRGTRRRIGVILYFRATVKTRGLFACRFTPQTPSLIISVNGMLRQTISQ